MFGRFFTQSAARLAENYLVFPKKQLSTTRVGRMAPETTVETVKEELHAELREKGFGTLSKTLNEEQIILQQLQSKQKEVLDRIKKVCLTPTQERYLDGYSIRGLFWEEKQKLLNQIAPKDLIQENEEKIDWLTTRQNLFINLRQNRDNATEFSPKM